MIPFEKGYYEEKIREYSEKIKIGECGSFKIIKRSGLQGIIDCYLYNYEDQINLPIVELLDGSKTWMRISPQEIVGCYKAIELAHGKVGVVGLGLGYFVQEALKNKKVNEIIVYEKSQDVINLYESNFKEDKRVKIIQGDAFKAEKNNFDFFFVDIYEYKVGKKVAKDYEKLMALHNIEEYYFFGVEKFLLDCPVDELAMVYVREEWMAGARDMFERLNDAGLISKYTGYDNKRTVMNLLREFKELL